MFNDFKEETTKEMRIMKNDFSSKIHNLQVNNKNLKFLVKDIQLKNKKLTKQIKKDYLTVV